MPLTRGFTITDNLSLDTEIDKRTGKLATPLTRPTTCVDKPQTDSENKDGILQRLCLQHTVVRQRIIRYVCQTGEKTRSFPSFRVLGISWKDRVSNAEVLSSSAKPVFCGEDGGHNGAHYFPTTCTVTSKCHY